MVSVVSKAIGKLQASKPKGMCVGQSMAMRSKVIRGRQLRVHVRADSDDEIVPIVSGRVKSSFTDKDLEKLKHPHLLGGKTIGDELSIIRQLYLEQERQALAGQKALVSSNWDGDVYIGKQWNVLTYLYLIFMMAPAAVGVFAWLSYGKLWGVVGGGFY